LGDFWIGDCRFGSVVEPRELNSPKARPRIGKRKSMIEYFRIR